MKNLIPSLKSVCFGFVLFSAAALQPVHAQHQPEETTSTPLTEYASGISEEKTAHIALNFAEALRSENDGVRESAVFHGFLLQLMFPDVRMDAINKSLQHMVIHEPNPRIRHKAHIAWYFFEHGAVDELQPLEKIPKEGDFFRHALDVMNKSLLSNR